MDAFKMPRLTTARAEWDTRDWTCECYPDLDREMSTSVPPIPVPPYPDPCCCYGLPEYQKPGPRAFYLGMGYKAPSMRGPEFLRTPGYYPPQPHLPDYSVTYRGRGLLPPWGLGDLRQKSDVAEVYAITGSNGFQVEVTELGARLMSVRAPDVDGVIKDVLLGFDSPEVYWTYSALHWGGVAGRLADRVPGPRPTLHVHGVGSCLFPENSAHDHYMGGEKALDRVIWDAHVRGNGVVFTYVSRAGEEGYPGDVVISVTYTVLPKNKLVIHMEATSTVATPFALMLPLVFNLAGYNAGEAAMKDHVLNVYSDKFYAKKATKRITGSKKHVANTVYDLRIPRQMRKMLRHAPDKSYDLLMRMDDPCPGAQKKQRLMARLFHPSSRRTLELWSDQPVLHVATDLGITRRPRKPPDPVLLDEARKIIEEIIVKITPCDDYFPPTKYTFFDAKEVVEGALKNLNEFRPSPNPGDVKTVPVVDRAESIRVATEIIEEILSRVKERPPVYLGYNSYRYYDDCGILFYPQLTPLLPGKTNVEELVLRPGQRYSHTTTYVFGTRPRPEAAKRLRYGRQRSSKRASDTMVARDSLCSYPSATQKASFVAIHDVCSAESLSDPSI